MSRTTDYILELLDQEMRDWICQQLDDEDADEDTPGWDELAQEWAYMHESHDQHDFDWFESHSYSEVHRAFNLQLEKLKELLGVTVAIHHEETFYKMAYAHAVTLMESFLSDTVRSLIISEEKYFVNALSKVKELSDCKFTIKDIAAQKDGAKGFAVQVLADVMYHNLPKVKKILEGTLGRSLTIDISEVSRITYFRHDIVHRDGKTIDGKLIKVDKEIVEEAVEHVERFVNAVAKEVCG